jgi:hypothetical protein
MRLEMTATAEPSPPFQLTFVTTVEASVDAHALRRPRVNALDRTPIVSALAGLLNIALGVAWNLGGLCALGVLLLAIAAFSVIERRSHPVLRWMIEGRLRGLLGKHTNVTVDELGLTFENDLLRSFVPWSSVTVARSNSRTLAFFHDALPMGYIPSSAFPDPDTRRTVLAFVEKHVTSVQRL